MADNETTLWFRAIGAPLEGRVRALAEIYVAGLELERCEVRECDLDLAVELLRRGTPSVAWWRAEERAVERLNDRIGNARHRVLRMAEDAPGTERLVEEALIALRRKGRDDAALARSAASAATLATWHADLARVGEASSQHPFLARVEMFELGRWPIGVYADAHEKAVMYVL